MLIPRPLCGQANAKGGATARELDDMLWAAVEPTAATRFVVSALGRNFGEGRDKRPTGRPQMCSMSDLYTCKSQQSTGYFYNTYPGDQVVRDSLLTRIRVGFSP
jgi:hypothetical protein